MPKQTQHVQTDSRQRAEPEAEIGPKMKGCDILIKCLEREGVEVVFGYPGGASMEMHQALTRSKKIRVILPRHEQGEGFMAQGYARATGKAGVCFATSGPGATNLVTPIADAWMDSIPMVAITGQVPKHMIGRGAFQETDFLGVTLPIVKHSYLVMDVNDIPRVIKEAFHIATTGRPGPVVVDIPKDVQQAHTQPVFPSKVSLRGYDPIKHISDHAVREIAELIAKAEKPMIYCGGGIISGEASGVLLEFAEKTNIPVATTLMGIGCFPQSHRLSLKWLGMHGTVYSNFAVDKCDLLLAIGVRFDDRVTGKVSEFAKHATIVHIDVDPSEINKNKVAHIPVVSDIKYALHQLNKIVKSKPLTDWHKQIEEWRTQYPFKFKDTSDEIQPQYAIRMLWELTKGEAIITTGVGQHQMWAGQFYEINKPRTFLSSAGLGSMGFGLPAAIGAKVAFPDKQVIDIDGDGSFIMNIQELACAYIENIPIKVLVLNNQHLGMVAQWEDRFYSSNRAHTYLGDPRNPKKSYPDFVRMCEGFGLRARQVIHKKDLRPAMEEMLASKEAYVLDVLSPFTEHVLPMIPAGKTVKDIIIE
jgi:acetolactate synthase-1/2/3 large subunit